MKLDLFNPSHDDLMNSTRILYRAGDVWKQDNDGIPHRMTTMYGDLLTVKVPENVPMKHKGRKLSRILIACNACELVTGLELHYGRPETGGYVLVTDNPDRPVFDDVSRFYRNRTSR